MDSQRFRVHPAIGKVGVKQNDAALHVFEHGIESDPLQIQRFLHPPAFGNVTPGHDGPDNHASFVTNGSETVAPDPRFARIFAAEHVFGILNRLAPERPRHRPLRQGG